MAREVVLVKLGGSLITDKEARETPHLDVIERLAAELAAGLRGSQRALVLAHGSGSFGHFAAHATPLVTEEPVHEERRPELRRAAARTQEAAARLHRLVVSALLRHDVPAFSVAPSSCFRFEAERRLVGSWAALLGALERGMVPVTYGDVVAAPHGGYAIASTEDVLCHLTSDLLRAGYRVPEALWLGRTPGLLGDDGTPIPRIDEDELRPAVEAAAGAAGVDVTGGMALRLDAAWAMAQLGVVSRLLDGRPAGALAAALAGRDVGGTLVRAGAGERERPRR